MKKTWILKFYPTSPAQPLVGRRDKYRNCWQLSQHKKSRETAVQTGETLELVSYYVWGGRAAISKRHKKEWKKAKAGKVKADTTSRL